MPLVEGIFFGIVLSLMIGPVFFVLLQTSLEKGKISGLGVAFGAALSDLLIFMLCLFGFMTLALNGFYAKALGYVGVLILIASGYSLINKPKHKVLKKGKNLQGDSPGQLLLKGFFINALNPFVFVFWMGVVGFLTKKYASEPSNIFLFVAGVFTSIFIADIIKVFLSDKVRPHLKRSNLRIVSMLTGVALIGYGIILFYKML